MIQCVDNYRDIPTEIQESLKYANPYYSEEAFEFEKKNRYRVLFFYDSSQILVAYEVKKYFFRSLQLPTEPYVWSAESINLSFLDDIVVCCQKSPIRVDWVGPCSVTALFSYAPKCSISIPFGSYILDLGRTEDSLWDGLHSKHRNVVRRAQKNNVIIKYGGLELLDDYLQVEKMTWERSNMKLSLEKVYRDLFEKFPSSTVIFVAYYEGVIQGGAIFVFNSAMAYYLYGASRNSPVTGAMNLLQWEAINYFKNQGVKKYSFVGCRINEDPESKYHGIQEFKKRFGGTLFVGRMFKVILNSKKYRLYGWLKKIKNHGHPVLDIIDQEIDKWNGIEII